MDELDTNASPRDWALYRVRDGFSLFELACLLHRMAPKAVFDDARRALIKQGGVEAEILQRSAPAAAELLYLNPALYFIPPVGDTLESLKLAAGSRLGLSVDVARAHVLAAALGLPYPPELEREAPAQAAAKPGLHQQDLPDSESPKDRRARRLQRFRELGGDMRKSGDAWQITGKRRALTELVSEEQAAARPMRYRQDVTADLHAAMAEQMQS